MDSESTLRYINRELSWLEFNGRVLEEAADKSLPVLERLKFLGITASNLDEFFMVRVAGLAEQVEAGYTQPDASGKTPGEQLSAVTALSRDFMKRQYNLLLRSLLPELRKKGIEFMRPRQFSQSQKIFLAEYFDRMVFPTLTPLAVDSSRPFPLLSNKSLNLAVKIAGEEEARFAVVQVPSILHRLVEVPDTQVRAFAFLEDIIALQLEKLFADCKILSSSCFRITRNADLLIDEGARDLLLEVEKSVKQRKRGNPVRLELDAAMDADTREFLMNAMEVSDNEVFAISGPLNLSQLANFAFHQDFPRLRKSPITPRIPADFSDGEEDIFAAIRQRDRLVHLPYESFDCVINLVRRAAMDKNVLAIKQSLYRVSGDSPIIKALIEAAENGKQVTVLVELRARFDEENNIQWAKRLEDAGCHVVYGLHGLKVHCKMLLVVRREEDGIRRYVHMATGNYNDTTAKLYTDIGMFTARDAFGADASSLFNVITGYSSHNQYKRIITSPADLRPFLKQMIAAEAKNAANGLSASITMQMNSLSDIDMVDALYAASGAGVRIELFVRGICCLVPGVPELSENITVHSIIGQFLEHSRIFCFENAGNPKVYIGSADMMSRNLSRRVETIFPIEDEDIKTRILNILEIYRSDTLKSRKMLPDGSYERVSRRGKPAVSVQATLAKMAEINAKNAANRVPGAAGATV